MNISSLGTRVFRLTVVSGIGLAGYLLGRYENKVNESFLSKITNEEYAVLPLVRAASVLFNDNKPVISSNQSDQTKDLSHSNVVENVNQPNRISQVMKYGFPSLDNIRSYGNFVLSYDRRNRVAHWVCEHLTKDTVKRNSEVDRSKCNFFEDVSIHPYFRSTNSDYKLSGYDRGHLAAAGNHKANQKTCEQTFILSNMAPQVGEGFNRNKWNDLEKYVRKLVRKYSNVYVCTGPLYLPRVESDGKSYVKYQVIGKNTVAVPTHFFKVIVMESADHNLEMESYVLPNQPISDNVPLSSFLVPVESIERASGLLLFDKIPKKSLRRIN